eukprot:s4267_g9.t2
MWGLGLRDYASAACMLDGLVALCGAMLVGKGHVSLHDRFVAMSLARWLVIEFCAPIESSMKTASQNLDWVNVLTVSERDDGPPRQNFAGLACVSAEVSLIAYQPCRFQREWTRATGLRLVAMKGIQTVKRRINNEESQQAAAEPANSTAEAPNQRPGAPKGEATFSALPKLHDEVPADRPELFKRKLQACCTVFDFNSETDMKAKEAKRQTLLELVEYVNSTRSCFQESLIPDIVKMVASNIFRALPAKDRSSMSLSDPDEEEPVLEKAWPHLQIVYEFFLRFVVSNEVDPKVAKLSLDTNFVSQMLELFDSDDPRERDYVKTITHRIYGKFMALRAFIRRAIQNAFFKVMYECEMHNGVGELLEILGSIINGFALPLKEEHKDFLVRALIPLHKMKQYVEKDPRLAYVIITSMLRYWPATITSKQVLFLNELEELLELTKPPEFIRLQDQLFQRLASCITCPHFQVAERTLFLWNNDYIVRLITSSRKVLFPVVIGALYMNSKQHWNSAVHGLTFNVLKLLMEADPQLFDECSANHKEAYDEEEQREAARQQKWARLQELFDKRHTAAVA